MSKVVNWEEIEINCLIKRGRELSCEPLREGDIFRTELGETRQPRGKYKY